MAKCDDQDVPGEIFCTQTLLRDTLESQYDENNPIAFKASADPDRMYLHEAMNNLTKHSSF